MYQVIILFEIKVENTFNIVYKFVNILKIVEKLNLKCWKLDILYILDTYMEDLS